MLLNSEFKTIAIHFFLKFLEIILGNLELPLHWYNICHIYLPLKLEAVRLKILRLADSIACYLTDPFEFYRYKIFRHSFRFLLLVSASLSPKTFHSQIFLQLNIKSRNCKQSCNSKHLGSLPRFSIKVFAVTDSDLNF